MQSLISKCVDVLLEQPEETLLDKDDYIVKSLVKGMDCFVKICKIAMLYRHRDLSEAKVQEISVELSKALFYTSLLTHLLDIEADAFEVDALTEFSETFPDEHQQDSILCSLGAIRNFADIAELKFGSEFEELPGADELIPDIVEQDPDADSDPDPEGDVEVLLAEIYASVIILCERFDLDLEIVMENVSIVTKP